MSIASVGVMSKANIQNRKLPKKDQKSQSYKFAIYVNDEEYMQDIVVEKTLKELATYVKIWVVTSYARGERIIDRELGTIVYEDYRHSGCLSIRVIDLTDFDKFAEYMVENTPKQYP